jgi:hypothetical protein
MKLVGAASLVRRRPLHPAQQYTVGTGTVHGSNHTAKASTPNPLPSAAGPRVTLAIPLAGPG